MVENPLVSFIIPFYNADATLGATLESIFRQTYKNFDVWIVNDGSTEADVLQSFVGKSKINIIHQDNAGPSVARNNGIKQCKGEIIVPLDADDLISENALEIALPFLIHNKEVGVVYADLQFFGTQTDLKKQVDFDLSRQFIFNQLAVCAMIKKEVFETCGYYDEFLSKPGLEDWEFWIRVGAHGWVFIKTEDVFFHIRVNESSRTFQVANKNLEMIREYVFKKHATLVFQQYNDLFYKSKMLQETPDFKIGKFVLKPWRFIKMAFQQK